MKDDQDLSIMLDWLVVLDATKIAATSLQPCTEGEVQVGG
jgi:hypothetical protein